MQTGNRHQTEMESGRRVNKLGEMEWMELGWMQALLTRRTPQRPAAASTISSKSITLSLCVSPKTQRQYRLFQLLSAQSFQQDQS